MSPKKKQPRKGVLVMDALCKGAIEKLNRVDRESKSYLTKGYAGGSLKEPLPLYNEAECEKVIGGANNTWIVLGRDRPQGLISGRMNYSQAGAIDIVVGRMGAHVVECEKDGEKLHVDPMFSHDAARIHISQQTDIDLNFRLAPGKVGSPGLTSEVYKLGNKSFGSEKQPMSGIALKADGVRIIARRGIKLVTMQASGESISTNKTKTSSIKGIDLIAGNQTEGKYFDIQPIVKGDNLVKCLDELIVKIGKLDAIVFGFAKYQHEFNAALANHQHHGIDGKTLTAISFPVARIGENTCKALLDTTMTNLEDIRAEYERIRNNYTKSFLSEWYVNSRWNYVN